MNNTKNHWTDNIIPCDCPQWATCQYGTTLDWEYKRYAVCGYSFTKEEARGSFVGECKKYTPKVS
jgi:hypothetical protein